MRSTANNVDSRSIEAPRNLTGDSISGRISVRPSKLLATTILCWMVLSESTVLCATDAPRCAVAAKLSVEKGAVTGDTASTMSSAATAVDKLLRRKMFTPRNSAKSTPMSRRVPRQEQAISGANSQRVMQRASDIGVDDRHSRRFRQTSPTRSSEFVIRRISSAPGQIDRRGRADNFV